jgi:hypothetical protein
MMQEYQAQPYKHLDYGLVEELTETPAV